MRTARAQRGSGWLEFSMVVGVLAVLCGGLARALLDFQAAAEREAVTLTVLHLRTALRWEQMRRLQHGTQADLAALVDANPVTLLERPPARYLGERAAGGDIAGGSWYFDPLTRELAYRPGALGASVAQVTPAEARWRIAALKDVRTGAVSQPVEGLALVQTQPLPH